MQIVGALIWAIAVLVTFGWIQGIRRYVSTGLGVTKQTVNTAMLFLLAMGGVAVLGHSPFHLLWLFPASWIVGTLSISSPLSLLSIPGHVFGHIFCAGIDPEEARKNARRFKRFRELVSDGMPKEEAAERVKREEAEAA
jgi:hypothetical protein